LAALYPSPMVRGPSLQRIYFAADLIGIFVAAASFLWWLGRTKRSPSIAQDASLFLLFCNAAILLSPEGPWRTDVFGDFAPAQVGVLLLFTILTAFQVALWRFTR